MPNEYERYKRGTLERSTIHDMVSIAFDDVSVEIVRDIDAGRDLVYHLTITIDDGDKFDAVLKVAGETAEEAFPREPALVAYVDRHTDIPVPDVYAREPNPPRDSPPFFLMEYIDGVCLDSYDDPYNAADVSFDREAIASLATTAGRHLAQIHDCGPVAGIGNLVVRDGELAVTETAPSWRARIRSALNTPWLDELGDLGNDITAFVEREAASLPSIDPVPMHGDYRPGNLIVDPETKGIVAVLDWGGARSGHREFDLVLTEQYLSVWYPPGSDRRRTVREHLYEGYRQDGDIPPIDAIERRRSLYRIVTRLNVLWRLQYLTPDLKQRRLGQHGRCMEAALSTANGGD